MSVDPQPLEGNGDLEGLVATATVLLPSVKAKLFVSFILDSDTLWAWPMSIGNVDCEIRKAYGPEMEYVSPSFSLCGPSLTLNGRTRDQHREDPKRHSSAHVEIHAG